MPRDFTASQRAKLLREQRKELGLPDEPIPTHRVGPEGGYLARLARELRALHDDGKADKVWIATNDGKPSASDEWVEPWRG